MPDVATDIQFDSYSLQDSTVITEVIDGDDSMPKKAIGLYELPVLHGAKKTFEKYEARHITMRGVVKSTTASGLVGKMEELKEVVSRQDKQLTITYPSYTRIYTGVSSEAGISFDRPAYAVNIADFSLTFVAPEPWSVQTTTSVSGVYGITSSITNLAVGISGMLDPEPYIFFNTTTSGSRFSLTNTTTGDTIDITTTFSGSGRSLLIDCYSRQVTIDGLPTTFKGVFPRFKPNVQNTLVLSTFGNATGGKDQAFEDTAIGNTDYSIGSAIYRAQSFVPGVSGTLPFLEMYLKGISANTARDVTVEIRSDNSGTPSSTVLATATISSFDSASPSWKRALFSSGVSLTSGTTYWIVAYTNFYLSYRWMGSTTSQYASGGAAISYNRGVTWTAYTSGLDHLFRTYLDYSAALAGKLVIQYNPRRM